MLEEARTSSSKRNHSPPPCSFFHYYIIIYLERGVGIMRDTPAVIKQTPYHRRY